MSESPNDDSVIDCKFPLKSKTFESAHSTTSDDVQGYVVSSPSSRKCSLDNIGDIPETSPGVIETPPATIDPTPGIQGVDPSSIKTLAHGKRVLKVQQECITTLCETNATLVRRIEKLTNLFKTQQEANAKANSDVLLMMLKDSKDQLEKGFGQFQHGMDGIMHNMDEMLSDRESQKLLLKLGRHYQTLDFGCSNGSVYIPLQNAAKDLQAQDAITLTEYEYGIDIKIHHSRTLNGNITYTVTTSPDDLVPADHPKLKICHSIEQIITQLDYIIPQSHNMMLAWIARNPDE